MATAIPTEDHSYLTAEFIELVRTRLQDEVAKLLPKDEENGSSNSQLSELVDTLEYEKWVTDPIGSNFTRYVKRKKGDIDSTIPFLIEVLKWRKRLDLSNLSDQSFPKEFFHFGGIHVYGHDVNGNSICHIRLRLFYRQPEILDILKKFVVYQMLRADKESAERAKIFGRDVGWVLLFDCTGAGVSNADMDMTNFLNSTLKNYFPYGQKYVLNHNIPWLLNAIKNVVFTMLPSNVKRRIKFSNDKTIHEFIPIDQLPPHMGGTNTTPYPIVPGGVIPTSEMVKQGSLSMTSDEELRVQKYYERVYAEIRKSSTNVNSTSNGHSNGSDGQS